MGKRVIKNPGRHARAKGHGFERWVANALVAVFPNARRQLEFHSADANGVDLQNTGRFLFQCKKLKQYAPINYIKEVQYEPGLGQVPVLVTAADNQPAMAVLPFADFVRLLECAASQERG